MVGTILQDKTAINVTPVEQNTKELNLLVVRVVAEQAFPPSGTVTTNQSAAV